MIINHYFRLDFVPHFRPAIIQPLLPSVMKLLILSMVFGHPLDGRIFFSYKGLMLNQMTFKVFSAVSAQHLSQC